MKDMSEENESELKRYERLWLGCSSRITELEQENKSLSSRLKEAEKEADHNYEGCICSAVNPPPVKDGEWKIDPNCKYHQMAERYPKDHSIPWNCSTYWDGCNCKDTILSLEQRLSQAEAELEQVHKILDGDPSMIIRNAKDGYPEGRPDRILTLAERVKALCKYGSDYVRWLKESEARLSHLMDVGGKMAEWVEGYIDYLGHEDCGNECQHGQMSKEMEALIAEWDGIKDGGK